MITVAEREDIAAIGRYVRRAELAARAEEQKAAKLASQGRDVLAHLHRVSAQHLRKTAHEMKAMWGKCDGFAQGYCT